MKNIPKKEHSYDDIFFQPPAFACSMRSQSFYYDNVLGMWRGRNIDKPQWHNLKQCYWNGASGERG